MLEYFIAFPLFKLNNRHQDAVALLQYLKPYAPAFADSLELKREQVSAALFGHRSNPDAELRKAMSNLNNIVRKMILLQQLNNSENDELLPAARADLALLQFLSDRLHRQRNETTPHSKKSRPSDSLAEQVFNSLMSKTNPEKPEIIQALNANQYQELLHIRFEALYQWYNFNALNGAPNAEMLMDAIQAMEFLFQYLRYDLLTTLEVKLHIGNSFKDAPERIDLARDFLSKTLQAQVVYPFQAELPPQIEVYRQSLTLLQHLENKQGIQAFHQLDECLRNQTLLLPREQIQGLKAVLRLYCGIVINRTQSPFFQQKRFELFRDHILEEMLLRKGAISPVQLSSLISDALRLGAENHGWATDFLQQFENGKCLFGTETPREIYKVNKANLLFHQGFYREAANELIGYEWYGRIDEPQVLLLAIRIDLKTRYERSLFEDEHTLRTLEAAEKRVARLDELNPQLSGMTLAFLRFVKQLFNVKTRLAQPKTAGSRQLDLNLKRTQLLASLQEHPVAEKVWLQEKIGQL